jgi:hypothetical protein
MLLSVENDAMISLQLSPVATMKKVTKELESSQSLNSNSLRGVRPVLQV